MFTRRADPHDASYSCRVDDKAFVSVYRLISQCRFPREFGLARCARSIRRVLNLVAPISFSGKKNLPDVFVGDYLTNEYRHTRVFSLVLKPTRIGMIVDGRGPADIHARKSSSKPAPRSPSTATQRTRGNQIHTLCLK